MKLFITFTGIVLLSLTSLFSQEKATDSTKTEQLNEVIITAQYAPQTEQNAIYKVKSISSEIIEQKAASNLRELLQQELNIDISQNSVFGTSVEMQGISKENIKILIDGIPVIGRLNGVIDLNQINLETIERIEIVEGPVSVFYGTDAMGGVINLITKQDQKNTIDGSISALYESIEATNFNGNLGYKFDDNLIKVSGGYYHFNGLSTNEDLEVENLRNLNWEERQQYFGDFTFIVGFGDLKLRYNANLNNEKLISLGDPDRFDKIFDKDYFTRRINNNLNLQGKISENKFIDVTASFLDYQRYHDTYIVDPVTFEKTLSESDTKDDNIVIYRYSGIKAQLGKNNINDRLNYAVGFDFNDEVTKGERILDKKQNIETIAVFGSINYSFLEKFEIQPSARYTYNSSYGSLFSPAINLKAKFNNNNVLRFSYANGFRAPSLKELYLDFHISAGPFTYIISGNENLEVEESHSFNLYYSFRKDLKNSSNLTIEPSLFYNDIDNLIALSELANFKRHYINIDEFRSLGGKIDVNYKLNKSLSINGGFSLIGRSNKFNEDFDTDEFLFTPEVTSTINYSIEKIGLNASIFYKYSGERTGFFIDEDTNELNKTTRESFSNLDATLVKSFFKNTLVLTGGIKNIFDVKDIETTNEIGSAHARDMQLWGRSFFIKTTFKF
ncbi:MAG: TonB-dependent receptor [Flavobacteriaceae bacterium]